jgi:hypothetical protein
MWAALAVACSGCGAPALTPGQAADLLTASPALAGVETLTYTVPRGCVTLEGDQRLDGTVLDRDPRLSQNAELKVIVARERRLDLLDFEFSPTPITTSSPPEGCEQLWAAYHSTTASGARSDARLVGWRALMSDKALAAGLRPGQSFVTRRQTLIAVGTITMKNGKTAVVDYTWHWAPSFETQHLGIDPSEPVRSNATFTRESKKWRLMQ